MQNPLCVQKFTWSGGAEFQNKAERSGVEAVRSAQIPLHRSTDFEPWMKPDSAPSGAAQYLRARIFCQGCIETGFVGFGSFDGANVASIFLEE